MLVQEMQVDIMYTNICPTIDPAYFVQNSDQLPRVRVNMKLGIGWVIKSDSQYWHFFYGKGRVPVLITFGQPLRENEFGVRHDAASGRKQVLVRNHLGCAGFRVEEIRAVHALIRHDPRRPPPARRSVMSAH